MTPGNDGSAQTDAPTNANLKSKRNKQVEDSKQSSQEVRADAIVAPQQTNHTGPSCTIVATGVQDLENKLKGLVDVQALTLTLKGTRQVIVAMERKLSTVHSALLQRLTSLDLTFSSRIVPRWGGGVHGSTPTPPDSATNIWKPLATMLKVCTSLVELTIHCINVFDDFFVMSSEDLLTTVYKVWYPIMSHLPSTLEALHFQPHELGNLKSVPVDAFGAFQLLSHPGLTDLSVALCGIADYSCVASLKAPSVRRLALGDSGFDMIRCWFGYLAHTVVGFMVACPNLEELQAPLSPCSDDPQSAFVCMIWHALEQVCQVLPPVFVKH